MEDVIDYNPSTDGKETRPTALIGEQTKKKISRDIGMIVELSVLTESEMERQLGITNQTLRQTLSNAISDFEELVKTSKGRQFDGDVTPDSVLQEGTLSQIRGTIRSDWSSKRADNYYSKFRLSLTEDERSDATRPFHRKLLFRTNNHHVVPVSVINLKFGDEDREVFGVGTKEKSYVDTASYPIDVSKIASLSSGIIFPILAILLNPLFAAFSLFGLFYPWMVHNTRKAERPRILTILGERDELNVALFVLAALIISHKGLGRVRDEIMNKLMSDFLSFERIKLGNSLSFLAEYQETLVRVVCTASASYLADKSIVSRLLSISDRVVCVVEKATDIPGNQKTISDRKVTACDMKFLISSKPKKSIGYDHVLDRENTRAIHVDLQQLRKDFLSGSKMDQDYETLILSLLTTKVPRAVRTQLENIGVST